MEDYIFLIIAVVISIFAAINKNQKNKLADQTPEDEEEHETKRRNYLMDQLLGEDFLEEKEEIEKPPVRVQTAPTKVVFKTSAEAHQGLNYKLPRFKSTLPDRPKHVSIASTARKKVIDELPEEPCESIDYMEGFSLRKAVVYSIILEPKYEMES